jgi:hypothetical protein
MTSEEILKFLLDIWNVPGVAFIVSHIIVNVVVAVAAAVHTGTFELAKIGKFLTEKVLPYVTVYYIVLLLGEATGLDALAPAVFAVIEAALVGDLADSLLRLGLPLPVGVARLIRKRRG